MPIEAPHDVDKIRTSVRVDPVRVKAYIERLLADWPDESAGAATAPVPRTAAQAENALPTDSAARIALLEKKDAGAEGRWFLDIAEQLFGAIANSVRMWAHLPHLGKLVLPLQATLFHDGLLPAPIKCMALLRTSTANAAAYSLAHGVAMGNRAGLSAAQIRALAAPGGLDIAEFDARELAAIRWAERVANNTAKGDDGAFAELRAQFTEAEIVELTGACALANNFDRVHNALRVPVEAAAIVAALNQAPKIDSVALRQYLTAVVDHWPAVLPSPAH